MSERQVADRVIVGFACLSLLAGCAAGATPALAPATPAPTSHSTAVPATSAPAVSPASSPQAASNPAATAAPGGASTTDPPGWTRVKSPHLGYSIALPPSLRYSESVEASSGQRPYDIYRGTLAPEGRGVIVMVFSCLPAWPPGRVPSVDGAVSVSANGVPFQVFRNEYGMGAWTDLGDRNWSIMAEGVTDDASFEGLQKIIATIRPPGPEFTCPPAQTE